MESPLAVNVTDDTVNSNTVTSHTLLHELQLGERLNHCVQESRRSDFSLMLAMLCDDVREQSQFILPKSSPLDGKTTDKTKADNQTLRKYFDLPKEAPLSLKTMQQINGFNQAELIVNNNLSSLSLTNAISPKPLAFRDNYKHIPTNILNNTSVVCQEKHAKPEKDIVNKRLDMHVEGWLKSIQTSVVESKLVNVAA